MKSLKKIFLLWSLEIKRVKTKKFVYGVTMFGMAAVLTACTARQGEAGQERESSFAYQEETFSSEDTEIKEKGPQAEGPAETEPPREDSGTGGNAGLPIPEVSGQEAEIVYAGGEFTKSVFSAGGGMLYVYGIKDDGAFFLGNMKAEENSFREIPLSMPEDMRVMNMYTDEWGNCHTLWLKVEESKIEGQNVNRMSFEEGYIVKIGKEGQTEFTLDISEALLENQNYFYCFAADREGNYYFENNRQCEIIKLGPDGKLERRIPCEGSIETVGIGRSGAVYCIYAGEDGTKLLGRVEEDSVSADGVELPKNQALYSEIDVGTDTELLIYNKSGGVYVYSPGEKEARQRIKSSDLPVREQEVGGYGFVGDGRLCLQGQKDGKMTFYYIPAGKPYDGQP